MAKISLVKMNFRPIAIFVYTKFVAMGAAELREELHGFIDRADDRLIRLMYTMVKADFEDNGDQPLSDVHTSLLDERLTAHKISPLEGSSWDEVKSRLRKK